LRHSKFGVITLLLFGIVISLTGIVCADQVVPAVPETQALSTVTTADVVGLAMETDAGAWTLTNNAGYIPLITDPLVGHWPGYGIDYGGRDDDVYDNYEELVFNYEIYLRDINPGGSLTDYLQYNINDGWKSDAALQAWLIGQTSGIHTGALYPGQVQYTTAYDANIMAQGGHTAFTKSMLINTGNKVIGQSNINAQTGLTFIATADGGNVVGSENLMIDGAGNTTTASDRILCPFSAYPVDIIPAYCNIVQAGSKYDLTIGSVTTNANTRFVGTDATNPVVLNYDINVKPYSTSQGQILASGSAMAYLKAHIQEARGNGSAKAEDLTYNEQSSAQGTITAFTKVIAYQSGKSLL